MSITDPYVGLDPDELPQGFKLALENEHAAERACKGKSGPALVTATAALKEARSLCADEFVTWMRANNPPAMEIDR